MSKSEEKSLNDTFAGKYTYFIVSEFIIVLQFQEKLFLNIETLNYGDKSYVGNISQFKIFHVKKIPKGIPFVKVWANVMVSWYMMLSYFWPCSAIILLNFNYLIY